MGFHQVQIENAQSSLIQSLGPGASGAFESDWVTT